MSEPVVTHAPELTRYELRMDDRLVGLADYRRLGDRVTFTHTEVDPSLRGRGLAGRLVEAALEDARREGLAVVPVCPFVAWYIQQNPEYANLVADD